MSSSRRSVVDAIGCSMRPNQDAAIDPIFFVNEQAALVVVDGEPIVLADSTTSDDSVIPDIAVGLTYSGHGDAATFAAVGPERQTSIESSERDVTLSVSTSDGRRTSIDGVLFCGV